jgi:hypothetical protein
MSAYGTFLVIERTFRFLNPPARKQVARRSSPVVQSRRSDDDIILRVEQMLRAQTDRVAKVIDEKISFIEPNYEVKRAEATAVLLAKVDERSTELFLQQLESKFKSNFLSNTEFAVFNDQATAIMRRLTEAVEDLERRSTVNLLIGMTTTAIAMVGLGFIALTSNFSIENWQETLAHFVPRLTFVVFIEVFAYFFLRLYKLNLDDVKYYQNELTNMEAKILSCRAALLNDDKQTMKQIALTLSKTERNFVLKKGETTTELEKLRTDTKSFSNELGKLVGLSKVFAKESK